MRIIFPIGEGGGRVQSISESIKDLRISQHCDTSSPHRHLNMYSQVRVHIALDLISVRRVRSKSLRHVVFLPQAQPNAQFAPPLTSTHGSVIASGGKDECGLSFEARLASS